MFDHQKNFEILQEFFHEEQNERYVANVVAVDMESKVINDLLQSKNPFLFNKDYCYSKEEGSGNNWAFGFNRHG